MTDDDFPRLVNRPAREAVDTLRGYSYQILRSIDAWLDLEEGQLLFLEGAEDLDLIDNDQAIVEQVKDTAGSGNLTLHSANALEAINNFWDHGERNPGKIIRFRYLTTSGVGKERGNDLTLSSKGIEVWESIRLNPSDPASLSNAGIIKTFLLSRPELALSMRSWLRTTPTEAFISRIIEPFSWVTSQSSSVDLLAQIEARLIELGEKRHIDSASCNKALGILHVEAWKNVTDKDRRPLRRGRLLQILEAAGTTAIPNTQLLEMLSQLTQNSPNRTAITQAPNFVTPPPRASRRVFRRPTLESAIAVSIDRGSTLIHGSTGMGKTILAAAVAHTLPHVGWIDLRDLDDADIVPRLNGAIEFIASQPTAFTIILDDFNPSGDGRILIPALDRLTAALGARQGRLLVTSAQRLAPRLASAIALKEECLFIAPSFNSEEIAAYFHNAGCGCPNEFADAWSVIVHTSTSGHPQLVDARLDALNRDGWPAPHISELLEPTTELVDVRSEARRMVAHLPADDRELLYRASLLPGRISRPRLMAIARIPPSLSEPGHVIDRLTGPWLEVTDTSDLRASPLLRNLGVETKGLGWSREMHGDIAWTWLAERALVATDISNMLMHAVISGRAGPLVLIYPSLLKAPDEIWKQIGEACGVFAFIGLEEGQTSPFYTSLDTAAFRILQLRIAEQVAKDKIPAVVKRTLQEADDHDPKDVGLAFFDFLFLWQYLREIDSSQSVQELVDHGRRFFRVGEIVATLLDKAEEGSDQNPQRRPDLSEFLKLVFFPVVTNVARFRELLSIAQTLGNREKQQILSVFAGSAEGASYALTHIWLDEVQRPEPDWSRLTDLLEDAIDLAAETGVTALSTAAASMAIRVTDENMRDSTTALLRADKFLSRLGPEARILTAKAKVMWRSGNPDAALSLYQEALPRFDLPSPWLTDTLRDAGISAARAERWSLCASYFGEALSSMAPEDSFDKRVAIQFDYGLCLHLAGETRRSVEVFGGAINDLIADGQVLPPEPLVSIRQLGSHAIKLVKHSTEEDKNKNVSDIAAFVGRCSAMEPIEWAAQRAITLEAIVLMMINLDLELPGGPSVAIALSDWLRQ